MTNRRIALFLQTLRNDYQELLRDDCLTMAARLRFSVSVFSADNDADKQVQQLDDLLCKRNALPIAILVSPVRESGLMTMATNAARLGIGWVVLSRFSDYLAAQRMAFPAVPAFCVMPDHDEIGRIQGKQFKALLRNGGELVYIRGPLGTYSAERRWAAMKNELLGTTIEPTVFNSDWSTDGGERAMRDWTRIFGGRELPACVVGSQNDTMAMGAREALIAASRDRRGAAKPRFAVTGCDGSPTYGQRLVTEGKLAATILVPPVAGRAVAELATLLEGGPKPPLTIVEGVASYPDLLLLPTLL